MRLGQDDALTYDARDEDRAETENHIRAEAHIVTRLFFSPARRALGARFGSESGV